MTVRQMHLQFNKEIEARKELLEQMLTSYLEEIEANRHRDERNKENIHPLHSRKSEVDTEGSTE